MTTHYGRLPLVRRTSLILIGVALFTTSGCSKGARTQQSSGGSVDTGSVRTGAATPSIGPGVHVTKTDSKSVSAAGEFRLTEENFAKFLSAADSLTSLEARDPTARTLLTSDLTDAGANGSDAGLKWLESNPIINNTVAAAGLSVRDYYVMGIAIAAAERFMGAPAAAPPTPALAPNAEFLRGKRAELDHLRSLEGGTVPVKVSP